MKREKPNSADYYNWSDFEVYADANGLGNDYDDWGAWWHCWVFAFKSAMK